LVESEVVRTYTFEVTVDYIVIVKGLEAVTDIEQLDRLRKNSGNRTQRSSI
jgi:hypothetical protein